jgi:hypothetical protein
MVMEGHLRSTVWCTPRSRAACAMPANTLRLRLPTKAAHKAVIANQNTSPEGNQMFYYDAPRTLGVNLGYTF